MKGLSNQAIVCSLCPAANGGPKMVFQQRRPQPPGQGRVSLGHMAGSSLKEWLCTGGWDQELQGDTWHVEYVHGSCSSCTF